MTYLLITLLSILTLNAPSLSADVLKIGFGNSLRPWVFQESGEGILIDIARASLESDGYEITPHYYPYARRLKAYRDRQIDVVTDINPNVIEEEGLVGYLSIIAYAYENFAFVLSKKNMHLKEIKDLQDLSVLAWQGATSTIGGDYLQMAINNPEYIETHDQQTQIKMLFSERVDVAQMDLEIFNYFRAKVAGDGQIDTTQSIDKFPLFGKNYCGFFFRSKEARDVFNRNFEKLKKSKKLTSIYTKYLQ